LSVTASSGAALRGRAAAVLHGNDAGRWTKASPKLYPHQWSWDSAFIAIGWAHLDVRRAMAELENLFAAQWQTGMVPHIVFRAGSGEPYFPGPEWWDCPSAPAAPALPIQTTGICQPPVHALVVQRIWQLTPQAQRPEIRARIRALYPRLVSWHRYLATQRDPEASGLVTVYHPWEGTDNSPRWDSSLARITVATPRPYTRLDTRQVRDPSQRPTDWDYDRLLWRSLSLLGYAGRADELRRDSLGQIAADGDFAEYFEPFTGKALGSPRQSWTAAVALDWLASDHGDQAS
jgi:glucosylglycerate hydrolase